MKIKGNSIDFLQKTLLGKQARFKSNCEFFPKFDVIGKVTRIYYNSNKEIIFEVILSVNKRTIKIGSNMSNLTCELLQV